MTDSVTEADFPLMPSNNVARAHLLAFLAVAMFLVTGAGCGGGKEIRHYQPNVATDMIEEASLANDEPDLVMGIEDFSTSPAYDEQRIVYRESPYRFDYYHYHRWSAPPGLQAADVMRQVYQATGAFEAVVGYSSTADVVLTGRVVAYEEVDHADEWQARVSLDLQLRDAMSGRMIWSDRIEQLATLDKQTPNGLAAAMSKAMTRIGIQTTPEILQAARTRKQIQNRPDKQPSSPPETEPTDSPDTNPN